jgi:hypothetical protein
MNHTGQPPMTFRIVIWNCNMALHKKVDLLMKFIPDVAVIPESAKPEIVKTDMTSYEIKVKLV